jgi:hypothetical protein
MIFRVRVARGWLNSRVIEKDINSPEGVDRRGNDPLCITGNRNIGLDKNGILPSGLNLFDHFFSRIPIDISHTTRAPFSAKARAVALPTPVPPPVIITILFIIPYIVNTPLLLLFVSFYSIL